MRRNLFVLLLASVFIAVFATLFSACGGDDDAEAETQDVTVSGWAYAHEPLEGAALSVSTPDGKTVVESEADATSAFGTFSEPAQLPADYRVTVDGGTLGGEVFTGKLVADVVDYGPSHGLIQVNPVTTLLAAYRDKHPDASPEQAQAAVRSFLRLPDGMDVTADLRGNEALFSAAAFHDQAEAAGGVQAFVGQLVAEIDADPGATQSFAGAPQNDITTEAMKAAAKALAKYGLQQLLEQVGLQPPDQKIMDTLDQISAQITRLEASVSEIKGLVLQADYNATFAPAIDYQVRIGDGLDKLKYAAQHPTARQEEKDGLKIADDLVSGAALANLHVLFKGALNKTGAAKLASDLLRSKGPFWNPEKSAQLLSVFDYFNTTQSQLVLLLAQRSGLYQQETEEDFENTVIAKYDAQVADEMAMRPAAAPAPIDMRSNLMWPINIGDRPDGAWGNWRSEINYHNGCEILDDRWGCYGGKILYGFQDWRMPTTDELKALVAGQAHPKAWLRDPNNWGPNALVRHAPLVDVVNVWSDTRVGPEPDPRYWDQGNHWGTNMDDGRHAIWLDRGNAAVWPVRNINSEKYWL